MTSNFAALVGVVVVAVGTYAMRAGLILSLADRALPDSVIRALRYVAPAVLAALTVSLIANPDDPYRGITAAELAGLVVTIPVAYFSKNLVITLAAAMPVFWIVLGLT